MGYKLKQDSHKKKKERNTNGWEALKEMSNIPSHQGNTNKNHFAITSYKKSE